MKEQKGEEKLVFSLWKKWKIVYNLIFGIIFCFFIFTAVLAIIAKSGEILLDCVLVLIFVGLLWFIIYRRKSRKRIELYVNRVEFWREKTWAWPKMEARYEDIRGACINKAGEAGDHVKARSRYVEFDVDTLCVYCEKGEYILFGLKRWGEEYSRRILDEILRRADAPESEPEEGEYGGGSRIAEEGFAELGVEEEPLPEDNPEENRFDIEAIVGCELYTKNGVRLGKIVQVLPAETDIYIVARDGKEMRLPAEEGIILDMDVERKRMTVDAERVFELLKEE